jgi:hypothetical protein
MQNARIVKAVVSCTPDVYTPLNGLDMNPEKLELLVTREMPYGKYKGRLIADLPGQYLNWFAREGFPSGELGSLLALMHEIDHNGLSELLDPLRKHKRPFRP